MVSRGAIVLAGLCAASLANAQQPAPAGVCAALAPQTGLKAQGDGSWRVNMLGGVGAAVFGGSTGATFQVAPIDGSTADQHLEKACVQNGAEITCRVVGPARITIGTKRGNASADIKAGETAEVGMKGRYLTCREG